MLAAAIPARAQDTATITGTITDAVTGEPLTVPDDPFSDFRVLICTSEFRCLRVGSTDVAGHYTIANLHPGTYHLRTANPSSHVPELFDDIPCIAQDCRLLDGTPVTLAAGETRIIDFALSRAGAISGKVTSAATGAPVALAGVSIFNAQTSSVRFVSTGPSGTYEVGGLAPGSYFLRVTAQGFHSQLASGTSCPLDSCRIASGTPIAVTAGAATIVDETLTPLESGAVAGIVRVGTNGLGQVQLQVLAGDRAVAAALTDASGSYRVAGLPPARTRFGRR